MNPDTVEVNLGDIEALINENLHELLDVIRVGLELSGLVVGSQKHAALRQKIVTQLCSTYIFRKDFVECINSADADIISELIVLYHDIVDLCIHCVTLGL